MAQPQEAGDSALVRLEKRLDSSAAQELPKLVNDLKEALLVEANRLSLAEAITDDDLLVARNRLCFPDRDSLQFADALFSPPHKFQTILALVVAQLGLDFEREAGEQTQPAVSAGQGENGGRRLADDPPAAGRPVDMGDDADHV
jgi:hypothetical protein